jgi:hypothetical protein
MNKKCNIKKTKKLFFNCIFIYLLLSSFSTKIIFAAEIDPIKTKIRQITETIVAREGKWKEVATKSGELIVKYNAVKVANASLQAQLAAASGTTAEETAALAREMSTMQATLETSDADITELGAADTDAAAQSVVIAPGPEQNHEAEPAEHVQAQPLSYIDTKKFTPNFLTIPKLTFATPLSKTSRSIQLARSKRDGWFKRRKKRRQARVLKAIRDERKQRKDV